MGYEGVRPMALAAAGRLSTSTARYYSANGGRTAASAAALKISLDTPIISRTFHPVVVLFMVIIEYGSTLELKY